MSQLLEESMTQDTQDSLILDKIPQQNPEEPNIFKKIKTWWDQTSFSFSFNQDTNQSQNEISTTQSIQQEEDKIIKEFLDDPEVKEIINKNDQKNVDIDEITGKKEEEPIKNINKLNKSKIQDLRNLSSNSLSELENFNQEQHNPMDKCVKNIEYCFLVKSVLLQIHDIYNQSKYNFRIKEAIQIVEIIELQFMQLKELLDIEINLEQKEYNEELIIEAALAQHNAKLETKYQLKLKFFEQINYRMWDYFQKYILNNGLKKLFSVCQELLDKVLQKNQYSNMHHLKVLVANLSVIAEIIPLVLVYDKNDLFSLQKSHQRWQNLYQIANIKKVGKKEQVKETIEQIQKSVALFNIIAGKFQSKNTSFRKKLSSFKNAIFYSFDQEKRKIKAKSYLSQPSFEQIDSLWNLEKNSGLIRGLIFFSVPGIIFNKTIYIKRNYLENISLEQMNQEKQKNNGSLNVIQEGISLIPEPQTIQNVEKCYSELFKDKSENQIPIRIFSHVEIQPPQKINQNQAKEKFDIYNVEENQGDSIIFHVQGGGFLSWSPSSHQFYIKKWAKKLKIPIFSVQYRLAPKNPFPEGLDDVWQAYVWLYQNCKQLFNINPKKIILVGDSAGGNLICALLLHIIKYGGRIPDGIVLVYPALNLKRINFSPSLLLALDDYILPFGVLKLILEQYLSIEDNQIQETENPYASPILISDEILQKFPPTQIFVGEKDPLSDDAWRFAEKLLKNNRNIEITSYKQLPHGFLSFGISAKEFEICIDDVIQGVNKLLNIGNTSNNQ